jgi:hypothetical protein
MSVTIGAISFVLYSDCNGVGMSQRPDLVTTAKG